MDQNKRACVISGLRVDRIETGSFQISWETDYKDLKISIYVGNSPGNIDRKFPAARVEGKTSATIKGLAADCRYYFEVAPERGPGLIAAERLVPMEGTFNFRDLGGYESSDGRHVKWGTVFRSDSLARLTDRDRSLLRRMGIGVVCDFRTSAELKRAPDLLPGDGSMDYLHIPVTNGAFDSATVLERMKNGDASWLTMEALINGYIKILDEFTDSWNILLDLLIGSINRPAVFHCTGGKDRTGLFAALILLLLGVPEETVIYDHALSNLYIAEILPKMYERIRSYGIEPEKVAPYFQAPSDCIVSLLDHIRGTYGSPMDYFRDRARVSEEKLASVREELLE